MPRKQVASNSSLGKQLIKTKQKKKFNQRKDDEPVGGFKVHTSIETNAKPKLVSVLEQNSLEEFVQLAQLSSKNFEAERASQVVFTDSQIVQGGSNDLKNSVAMVNVFLGEGGEQAVPGQYVPLTIPRRPAWDRSMTAHEIEQNENMAFLQWRRDIATMEQDNMTLAITPFEKNVDIWRQLWRVIEKCDLLLQIVDARNPYFFYSADLEKYIKEVGDEGKQFVLLVNKADYLSPELITHWNAYFKEKGIQHIFFSALDEQTKIDNGDLDDSDREDDQAEQSEEEDEDDDDEEEGKATNVDMEEIKQQMETHGGFKNELERQERDEQEAQRRKRKLDITLDEDLELSTEQVFSRAQLLTFLKKKSRTTAEEREDDRLLVGMVGYPNVGKSSVINVLMGVKKVGVAALPGKTKHFQTLNLNNEVQLCDCPGLVFPSFANSKAEMMCCGVLPIDQMRDHISPISLLLSRIPKEVLEVQYKIVLPPRDSPKYTTATFLQVFASKKGWKTGSGTPAEMHAAKVVMKDYTTGRLLHCQVRPDYNQETHGVIKQNGFNLDMSAAALISAQNYEEIDANGQSTALPEISEEQEEQKSMINTTTTSVQPEPLPSQAATGAQAFQQAEDDFDAQFFGRSIPKVKLNKGEKRQLKFEMRNGVNLNQVGDLKSYLNSKMQQGKQTHNTPHVGKGVEKGGKQAKRQAAAKTNTYKQLEDYVSD